MITLFGATGYTGRLIAHTLDAEGLPFRLAGRSGERLAALSAELPTHPGWLVADVQQPATLPMLFSNSSMLINCAGPFTDLGEKVIAQAAMAGRHYLDVTNELGYVFRARTYAAMARRSGAALVPACGFEVAFADCLAHVAGSALIDPAHPEPLDCINIVYSLSGMGSSAGTRQSAVRSLATSWIAYRDGDWTGQIPGGKVRKFDLPEGACHALLFPSSESVTVPAHLPVLAIDTWMATTPGARFWAPLLIPLFARLSRSVLRGLILAIARQGGMQPASAMDAELRADSPFTIYVEAIQGSRRRWMALTGKDPYGLTAKLAAYIAREMTSQEFSSSGLLSPSQAVDPQRFLQHAQDAWGMTLTQGSSS